MAHITPTDPFPPFLFPLSSLFFLSTWSFLDFCFHSSISSSGWFLGLRRILENKKKSTSFLHRFAISALFVPRSIFWWQADNCIFPCCKRGKEERVWKKTSNRATFLSLKENHPRSFCDNIFNLRPYYTLHPKEKHITIRFYPLEFFIWIWTYDIDIHPFVTFLISKFK